MVSVIGRSESANTGRGPSPGAWRTLLIAFLAGLASCAVVEPQIRTVLVDGEVVETTSGEIELERAGAVSAAQPGTPVQPGDVIRTGPSAQAVLLLEGGKVEVIVLENTTVRISSIWVEIGEVIVRIVDRVAEAFEVPSDHGVTATAEGTEFIFSVRENQYRCIVIEGRVRLRSNSGAWSPVTVTERQEALGQREMAPQPPRRMERKEYNAVIERINRIERAVRPGAAQLIVPELEGLAEREARRVLDDEGLQAGEITGRVTGKSPIGQVLRQSPAAGQRIKARQRVDLDVEAEPTTVPSVSGLRLADASNRLASSRLETGDVNFEITGKLDAGYVIRQDPPAGRTVAVGSAVRLWVEEESAKVPILVGLTVNEAATAIKDAKLVASYEDRPVTKRTDDGRIVAQSEPRDKLVKPGSLVRLSVGQYVVSVPSVAGMTLSQARNRLRQGELQVGGTSTRESSKPRDTVIEQDPRAGTRHPPGTSVDLVFAKPAVKYCIVPSVANLTPAQAASRIKSAGFDADSQGYGSYVSGSKPTTPPAGTSLPCGATVTINLVIG